MTRRAILWFRNDLRLQDNQLFHYEQVRQAKELLAIYCLDPRHFVKSTWGEHPRIAPHRLRFLAESIEDLDQSLQRLGSRLWVVVGEPEDVLPSLLCPDDVLAFQREDTHEEQVVEATILAKLPQSIPALCHWGHTLYHRNDLGWDPQETLPIPFGKFKFGVCDKISPRPEMPAPSRKDLPRSPDSVGLPGTQGASWVPVACDAKSLEDAMCGLVCSGGGSSSSSRDAFAALPEGEPAIVWRGGETAGLAQLADYMSPQGLGTYHRTRNQLHGAYHSSHLSPWLANGCLSPRTVFWRAKEYERAHPRTREGPFDHVYKFVFQLIWRDYYRFYCARFGRRVFFAGGPAGRSQRWRRDPAAESRWKRGTTGVPLVDALMRELLSTGFMANRGRHVVASYLVHYLGIDWRVGADWFEALLLDHDVCSNYGEWASTAGVAAAPTKGQPLGLQGRGPTAQSGQGAHGGAGDPWAKGKATGAAVFDPWEQAAQYDRTEAYVRRWVPELRRVPTGCAHWPHDMDPESRAAANAVAYPSPLATEPFVHATAGGPLDKGRAGRSPGEPRAPSDAQARNGCDETAGVEAAGRREVHKLSGSHPKLGTSKPKRRNARLQR